MNTMHEILREFPYGIYVVGVRGREEKETNALLVSWLTQCSFDPPLIMMALRRGSRSLELIREGKAFSVNIVDHQRKELARWFVKPADRVGDKLDVDSKPGKATGAPVLSDALAVLECRVQSITEPGDHALVIGHIVNAERQGTGRQMTCSDMHWTYGG
jgi:flavin reductase (DIM6/NTAB) family NADH-FMN oxidoreductase RutF